MAKLYLIGLGSGSTDNLTLKAWELLASGKPLWLRDLQHEVSQELLSRGFPVKSLEAAAELIPEAVVEWAIDNDESIFAVPGNLFSAPELDRLLSVAKAAKLDVEMVPAAEANSLPGSDTETLRFGAPMARRGADSFSRLVSIMARLRSPSGCPWDREQTHSSLAIHLLEEAHETLDAIDRDDMVDLEEELGDLLLQIVFHSELASERGDFEVAGVIDKLVAKLVHRHPHIFGDVEVSSSRDVVVNWEALKHEQKSRETLAEGLPSTLPALLYANKAQRRIAGASKDFAPSISRLVELARGLDEGDVESNIAALLYEIVGLAQRKGVDPEGALRKFSTKMLQDQAPAPRPPLAG